MTYPMSPLKRALLPRREGAVTVGYWHAHDDAKNSRFFWWERAEAEARYTPHRRNRRYRACWEGSWEGEGSLVGAGDSVVPCGGHEVSRRWKLHHRVVQLSVFSGCGAIFTPRERQTPGFRDVVACANDTPVPLRRQNRDIALRAWRIIAHRGSILTKMVFDKIGEGGGGEGVWFACE